MSSVHSCVENSTITDTRFYEEVRPDFWIIHLPFVKSNGINSLGKSVLKGPGGVCEPGGVEFGFRFDWVVQTKTIDESLNQLTIPLIAPSPSHLCQRRTLASSRFIR